MIRLRVLGGLSATVAGAPGDPTASVTRGYRLATLAVLAAAGDRGITRDRLQALLWADSDGARAGASLSQTLYGLKQDLGHPDIVRAAGPTLSLNTALVQADVVAFAEAYAAGDWLRAIELYGGPFVEGFYLRDALEFERWVDSTRATLSDQYAQAIERAAADAAAGGARDLAATLWKKRSAHDPLDSRVARQYMQALADAGDTAGALRHAQLHEAAVQDELGVTADPLVRRLANELREAARQAGTVVSGAFPAVSVPPGPAVATVPDVGEVPSERAEESFDDGAPPRRPAIIATPGEASSADAGDAATWGDTWRPSNPWKTAMPLLLVVAMVGALALAARNRTASTPSATQPTVVAPPARDVAILPFEVTDSTLSFLRDGMIDLLGPQIPGEGGLQLFPPRLTIGPAAQAGAVSDSAALAAARALRVPVVVRGRVARAGGGIEITARRLSGSGDPARAVTVRGSLDSLGTLVEQVALQLFHETQPAVGADSAEAVLRPLSGRPLAPLQRFLEGQTAYRGGRYADAITHFREALALDSTFSLAALGLARSGGFSPGGSTWRPDEAVLRAAEQRARLSARDRVLFEAFVGSSRFEPATAAQRLADWERAMALFPGDHEAMYWYGDLFFHTGQYLGIPDADRKARELFERAARRDSLFALPLAHLTELAAVNGDTATVRRLYARMSRLDESGAPDVLAYITWRTAVARGDDAVLARLTAAMDTLPSASLERIVTFSQLDGGIHLEDADRAASVLVRRPAANGARVVSLFVAHTYYLNRGAVESARRTLQLLREREPLQPGLIEHLVNTRVMAITDALFGGGSLAEAEQAAVVLDSLRLRPLPVAGPARATRFAELCALELWKLHRDDRSTVRETVRQLRAASTQPDRAAQFAANPGLCATLLEAQLAADEGSRNAPTALAALDRLMAAGPLSFGGHFGNLVVARLAERAGQPARALQAVRRRRNFPADGAVYLTTLLRLEARLAQATGDANGAQRALATLRALGGPQG